jgi:hypothetical protein
MSKFRLGSNRCTSRVTEKEAAACTPLQPARRKEQATGGLSKGENDMATMRQIMQGDGNTGCLCGNEDCPECGTRKPKGIIKSIYGRKARFCNDSCALEFRGRDKRESIHAESIEREFCACCGEDLSDDYKGISFDWCN